ncbi:MAG: RND transporter [Thiogranum sp.]
MKFLDKLPLTVILPLGVFLALAPFVPEPHLWQKLKMLFAGTLTRPVDIFDLFLHGTPLVLLVLKLMRLARQK